MHKVLVLDNTQIESPLINQAFIKAQNYFKEKGLDVRYFRKPILELVSIHEYDKKQGFNTQTGQPDTISWMGLDDLIKDNCRKYTQEGEYDCVMFLWNIDRLNHPLRGNQVVTAWTNFKPLYKNMSFVQIPTNLHLLEKDKLWLDVTHEQMHDFCFNLKRKGILVQDEMDTTVVNGKVYAFKDNDNPHAPEGNYSQTWGNLKPYLHLIGQDFVTVRRVDDDGKQTLGELSYNGFTCKTLERPWLNNQRNVSCIPKGEYKMKYTFSPKFMKFTYELLKVPNRSGIRIHSANYWFDLNGCIALGTGFTDLNKDGTVDIVNSRATVKKFEDLLGKKDTTIVIY